MNAPQPCHRRTLLWVLFLILAAGARGAELRVSTDFEGGSARVEAIDQKARVIRMMPGGDGKRGWPCWWYVRVDGAERDEKVTVDLGPSDVPARDNGRETGKPLPSHWAMPKKAAISSDGREWAHSQPGRKQGGRIAYEVIGTGGPLWVAWGPPFTPGHTEALISNAQSRLKSAEGFELARTREDRPVRALRIGGAAGSSKRAVWVQARQHAWESGASWVARGFTEWLTSDDSDALWMRDNAEVVVVPIMDVDNVATGNGGKEEVPHDHNRDWTNEPVFPEVAAAQKKLREWSNAGRLGAFVDLHNPGFTTMLPFFYVGPAKMLTEAGVRNRAAFIGCAKRQIASPLPLDEKTIETGPSYHPLWRQISSQWVNGTLGGEALAICLETPWNTPHSTTDGYRTVGRQLGKALAEYLRGLPEQR
jgi:hypothetical protein